MRYAFYPGCVAKGACPELKLSAENVSSKLGIDLAELTEATCTGAGIMSEHDQELGDTLNARTFAMAEKLDIPLMNICSTCQGGMSHSNYRLNNESGLLDKVNETLANEGLKYSGNLSIKNFMWVLIEDFGLDKLKSMIKKPLTGLKVAPFYGCYILRPSWELGIDENRDRAHYLEYLIEACGASPVDYEGRDKCCGFPIQAMNGKNSKAMAKNHVQEAAEKGADCMVTPCPLCHLQLDANQPDYTNVKLPILHLPQMIGLAIGLSAKELGLDKNIIKANKVLV